MDSLVDEYWLAWTLNHYHTSLCGRRLDRNITSARNESIKETIECLCWIGNHSWLLDFCPRSFGNSKFGYICRSLKRNTDENN